MNIMQTFIGKVASDFIGDVVFLLLFGRFSCLLSMSCFSAHSNRITHLGFGEVEANRIIFAAVNYI